jgi:hypothetical protein
MGAYAVREIVKINSIDDSVMPPEQKDATIKEFLEEKRKESFLLDREIREGDAILPAIESIASKYYGWNYLKHLIMPVRKDEKYDARIEIINKQGLFPISKLKTTDFFYSKITKNNLFSKTKKGISWTFEKIILRTPAATGVCAAATVTLGLAGLISIADNVPFISTATDGFILGFSGFVGFYGFLGGSYYQDSQKKTPLKKAIRSAEYLVQEINKIYDKS